MSTSKIEHHNAELVSEGLSYFWRSGDAGDREYVEAIRSMLAEQVAEIDRLREEVEALRSLLSEAADDIADWGAYAGEYFQQKHDLAGNVEKYRDAARNLPDPVPG